MTTESTEPLEIFYSYDVKDEELRGELEKHLAIMQRQKLIRGWNQRQINAGVETAKESMKHLNAAHIILLLVSPDYLASDYCYDTEVHRAMERYDAGEVKVLPILLRAIDYKDTPFGKLSPLPSNGVPVKQWSDLDDAFNNVAQGIRQVIREFKSALRIPESRTTEGVSPTTTPVTPVTVVTPVTLATPWNIPYRRNPFFTGRETLLTRLRHNLTTHKATALTQTQAIHGLGGIGKTQTAVEYAYRYRDKYRAILWVSAATRDVLIAGFVELATLLKLPEKDEQNQQRVVTAVKRWLEAYDRWLLILDNADDLSLVEEDLLPAGGNGHILFTTRAQAVGALANGIEVQKLDQQEGVLLLLRRARVLALDAPLEQAPARDRAKAEEIVKEMDGLPLALDQAGAYIEETGCSVAAYLQRYRQRQTVLLKRRGGTGKEHPDPVDGTWSLAFEQVERQSAVAADLLRVCAFLSPDAIPEELIVEGASQLGSQLKTIAEDAILFDEAISTLLRFSLIRRNREDNTLSIHRLVQVVLKASMDKRKQRQWAERTVRAVNQVFPSPEFTTWPQCQRLLAHAQVCADLINHHAFAFPEAARLLHQTAVYLKQHHALYGEAELLYERALAIRKQKLGESHPDTARSLNNLAALYRIQGRYEEAEPLYKQALAIRKQNLGESHPDTAQSFSNLALLYKNQGRYKESEPLCKQALEIRKQELGERHPDTATSLNNLAGLYHKQGRYEEAEPLHKRALEIDEQELGARHPNTAKDLNNLAVLYHDQGRYEEAEPLMKRALAIFEQVFGPDHLDTVVVRENYTALLETMKRTKEQSG